MSRIGNCPSSCSCLYRPFSANSRRKNTWRQAAGRRLKATVRSQAGDDDKTLGEKVPAAAQKTIDALSALLGAEKEEENQPETQQEELVKNALPSARQGTGLQKPGTEPASVDTPSSKRDPGQQRTGRPMELGSKRFDIPTVEPYIAYGLLLLNLAVYGAGVALALTQGNDFSNEWFLSLAKINDKVASGELYRLLTCTFLHAGLLHLGLNCYALFSIGPDVEAVLGYRTFAAIYILSGLGGSIASFLSSDLVSVGASGAIFGLLGASAGYFLRNKALQGSTQQLFNLALIVGLNFLLGSSQGSMIDNSGHLGGLVVGLLLSLGMVPRWEIKREDIYEDGKEVEVVVDIQPTTLRIVSAVSCALSLVVLTGVGMYERGIGQ